GETDFVQLNCSTFGWTVKACGGGSRLVGERRSAACYCCLLLPADYRYAGETMNADLLPDLLPCGFFFAGKEMETEEWRLESGQAKKENDG
ncbi:hypothetical protein SLEP1_g60150, partial [Rubroshorea leprosula]